MIPDLSPLGMTIREYFEKKEQGVIVRAKKEPKQEETKPQISINEDLLKEFKGFWEYLGLPVIASWQTKVGKTPRGVLLQDLLSTSPWNKDWKQILSTWIKTKFWKDHLLKAGIDYLLRVKQEGASGRERAVEEWQKWRSNYVKDMIGKAKKYMHCDYLPTEVYEVLRNGIYTRDEAKQICDAYTQQHKEEGSGKILLDDLIKEIAKGKEI